MVAQINSLLTNGKSIHDITNRRNRISDPSSDSIFKNLRISGQHAAGSGHSSLRSLSIRLSVDFGDCTLDDIAIVLRMRSLLFSTLRQCLPESVRAFSGGPMAAQQLFARYPARLPCPSTYSENAWDKRKTVRQFESLSAELKLNEIPPPWRAGFHELYPFIFESQSHHCRYFA